MNQLVPVVTGQVVPVSRSRLGADGTAGSATWIRGNGQDQRELHCFE